MNGVIFEVVIQDTMTDAELFDWRVVDGFAEVTFESQHLLFHDEPSGHLGHGIRRGPNLGFRWLVLLQGLQGLIGSLQLSLVECGWSGFLEDRYASDGAELVCLCVRG